MSSAWRIAALGQESASSTPLPAVGRAAVVEAGSATLDTAVDLATPESAASTPLPVFDPVAVFGASSATSVAAVGHATPESAASTPLPVPGPVAVFGAGSATHDTAVEQANYDDADYGDMSSEGDDEQPSTAYLIENENSTASTALQEGSKDGKLNPTQFASMKALKAKYRDNVRYRETRKALSLANEALVQAVMFDLAQRPTDSMLPENCETKWFQYGPCPVFVSKGQRAAGIITPDPAFETGKDWITAQWVESRKVIQEIRLSETLQERYAFFVERATAVDFCVLRCHAYDRREDCRLAWAVSIA
jgi:hypothetical protein